MHEKGFSIMNIRRGMGSLASLVIAWSTVAMGATGVSTSLEGKAAEFLADRMAEPLEWQNSLHPDGEDRVEFSLFKEGRPGVAILLPVDPTPLDRTAAEKLSQWLEAMGGEAFPVVQEGAVSLEAYPHVISIGDTDLLRSVGVIEHSVLGRAGLGMDGYTIAYRDGDLFLLGGERIGPIYAVLALLEEDLGFRWYSPVANRVPDMPENGTVTVTPRSGTPAFQWREHTYWPAWRTTEGSELWNVQNRLSGINPTIRPEWGGHMKWARWWVHSFLGYVRPNDHFEEHPEWFSYRDGERQGQWNRTSLCLSNEEMRYYFVTRVREQLQENPDVRWVDLSPPDRDDMCLCDDCRMLRRRWGGKGGTVLHLANEVAEALEDEFPKVTFSPLVYWTTKGAPPRSVDIQARPNVVVKYCSDWTGIRHPYYSMRDVERDRSNFERWREISNGRLLLWHYTTFHYRRPVLDPQPTIDVFADNLRFWSENGVEMVYAESAHNAPQDRDIERAWIFSKLMWDPSLDVDALYEDVTRGYYGKAAPALLAYKDLLDLYFDTYGDRDMRRFWQVTVPEEEFLQHGFTEQANQIFEKAVTLADSDEILQRVKVAWLPVVFAEMLLLEDQMIEGQLPSEEALDSLIQRWQDLASACEPHKTTGVLDGFKSDKLADRLTNQYEAAMEGQEVVDERGESREGEAH
ncbi:DUF4838 domain-containing protein [Phycisphaerales bacterium AB-hyl4]|uniref:DUF4838 domain-containing protein n=1 Tax=Natronomicrosphaera hydrolytica TaxID=3242702 RepID=A0ABV4U727_9BACT